MSKHTFLLDKLIRDKMIESFENEGGKLKYHFIDDNEEFLDIVTQKMVEELQEIFECQTKEEVIEEVADFEEVFHAFKQLIQIEQKEVDAARAKKKAEKGGFAKRLYGETVTVEKDSRIYKYCMDNPEKYPEVIEKLDD